MRHILRRNTEKQRGQSLVEFAMVGIILFGFLMGIMDAARLLFTYSVVSNAAQEGVHYAIVRPRDVFGPTDATNVAATQTRLPAATRISYIPQQVVTPGTCSAFSKTREKVWGLASSDINVSMWYDAGDGTPIVLTPTPSSIEDAARPGNRAVVEASYQFNFISPYLSIFAPNGINVKMRSARTIVGIGDTASNCTVNYTPAPTYTPTITNTPTRTSTPSNTPTITRTPTITNTPTITKTPTITPTFTPTRTYTSTSTPTNTPTDTFTNTPTFTITPTFTFTPTRTNTPTITQTPTRTNTPTITQTPTITLTPTFTPTPTITPTFTNTSTKTNTPTVTPTSTRTNTPTSTFTSTPTVTLTPTRTPVCPLTASSVFATRDASGAFNKDIQAGLTVRDSTGALVSGLTVTASTSSETLTLTEVSPGVYRDCLNSRYSSNVSVTFTVSSSCSVSYSPSRTVTSVVGVVSSCP